MRASKTAGLSWVSWSSGEFFLLCCFCCKPEIFNYGLVPQLSIRKLISFLHSDHFKLSVSRQKHTKDWKRDVPLWSTTCRTSQAHPLTFTPGEHLYGRWGRCSIGSNQCRDNLPSAPASSYVALDAGENSLPPFVLPHFVTVGHHKPRHNTLQITMTIVVVIAISAIAVVTFLLTFFTKSSSTRRRPRPIKLISTSTAHNSK
jgi:hypothetical protein